MNVLLLSMPDSFEHMPPVAIRMPNGALASLAGNVDPHHRVAIADLILVAVAASPRPSSGWCASTRRTSSGLSVMTFQRATALQDRAPGPAPPARGRASSSAATIRASRPRRTSHATRRRLHGARRGRAHVPRAAAGDRGRAAMASDVAGPVLPDAGRPACTTPIGRSRRSQSSRCGCPIARARVARAATRCSAGRSTSSRRRAGCTYDCSFCSIIEMRGRNFHPYPIERVLADIADARRHGARAIFLVDDNITLDVAPLRDAVPGDRRQRASTTSTTSCRR